MKLIILTYHYVRDHGGPYPGIHPISGEGLKTHIEMLTSNLHAATPEEVLAFANGETAFTKNSFFLTFDDGLIDHFSVASDILKPFGIRAAFFVSSRPYTEGLSPAVHKLHWLRANTEPKVFFSDLKKHLPSPWNSYHLNNKEKKQALKMHIHDAKEVSELKFLLNFVVPHEVVDAVMSRMLEDRSINEKDFCSKTFLDEKGLRFLDAGGHIVGGHGHKHAPLSAFDIQMMNDDIKENCRIIESIIGKRPTWLSYPYGREDALPKDCNSACMDNGYELGFTLLPGWNSSKENINQYKLRRITPNELSNWKFPN